MSNGSGIDFRTRLADLLFGSACLYLTLLYPVDFTSHLLHVSARLLDLRHFTCPPTHLKSQSPNSLEFNLLSTSCEYWHQTEMSTCGMAPHILREWSQNLFLIDRPELISANGLNKFLILAMPYSFSLSLSAKYLERDQWTWLSQHGVWGR